MDPQRCGGVGRFDFIRLLASPIEMLHPGGKLVKN
jgi:hypothetical protein